VSQRSRPAAKNRLLAALPRQDRQHLLGTSRAGRAAPCRGALQARRPHSPCLLPHRQLHLSDHSDRWPRRSRSRPRGRRRHAGDLVDARGTRCTAPRPGAGRWRGLAHGCGGILPSAQTQPGAATRSEPLPLCHAEPVGTDGRQHLSFIARQGPNWHASHATCGVKRSVGRSSLALRSWPACSGS
jgi:hypothetical protein